MLDTLAFGFKYIGDLLWGWPLIGFVLASVIFMTIMLDFIQFRYFIDSWKFVIWPEQSTGAVISPLQAFINSLSGSIGNGSLTGVATAIYAGGPGAAFWVFFLGFFTMSVRFAEVYAGTSTATSHAHTIRGGPMAYIRLVPGGKFLVYLYVFSCLLLTLFSANAMQCQAITKGIIRMASIDAYLIAIFLFAFLLYIMLGGAPRMLRVSDRIVPVKVGLFFISIIVALAYHYDALFGAIKLMIAYAFTPQAVQGGIVGYTVQDAIRFGMSRSLNATEAGLGTASILYGGTGSKDPMRSGIMAMATTFISNHLVCFTIMLLIVASGAWKSGIIGTGMTIVAYESVYGVWASAVVTLLSAMFGLGVLVTYAYIGRECWSFLTKGRYFGIYNILYASMALFGSLADVAAVWNSIDIAVAGLVATNLYALLWMLPKMRAAVKKYRAAHR